MINDYTSAVIRLENAYSSMQLARARAAAEIRAHYREVIKKEVAARQLAAEVEFARALAIEHEAGLPGNVIRTEVLRTNDWNRWKKWRDLAGIDPDRVTRENAKEAKEREKQAATGYLWSDDYTVLTITKANGKTLAEPVVYDIPADLAPYNNKGNYWPRARNDNAELVAARAEEGYHKNLSAEITRQVDAGNVPDNR